MSNPFQTSPLRSPDSNLFSPAADSPAHAPHSRTVGISHIASFTSAHHTASHPPLSPSGDSTVSSATADTILQPDLASFRDSVQSSLDKMQTQLHDVTQMAHNLEANVQLGLNTRFGVPIRNRTVIGSGIFKV